MLFDPDNPRNTLFQIKMIFNMKSTVYIISFKLNILVWFFFLKAFNEISWQDCNHFILSLFEEWKIWSFIEYLFLPNTPSSYYNRKMRDLNYLL